MAPEGLTHAKKHPIAQRAWEQMSGKSGNICTNMQTSRSPGYICLDNCDHRNIDQALTLLADAFAQEVNLTINTDPLPNGLVHPSDVPLRRNSLVNRYFCDV